jgi:cytochrome P450
MKTTKMKMTKTRSSKAVEALQAAGFKVLALYRPHPYGAYRWFAVVAPDGERGAVFCQHAGCWHFFSKHHSSTASSSSAARCHEGGLGDAIGSDGELRTYRRNLQPGNIPKRLRAYHGVYAAMCQVYES